MSKDYSKMANQILTDVGGPSNVSSVTHCMTRLRFNLKDSSIPKDDEVKNIPGVLGVVRAGGQYQVIIGQTVPDVYDAVLKADEGNLVGSAPIDENLDKDLKTKEKFSWKRLGNTILNKLAGSLTPLIPILMVAGVFKLFITVLGPNMLNILTAKSDLYITFSFIANACLYFLPIFVGYTAAKQFNTSPVLGLLMGAIMLEPSFVKIATSKTSFSVYGIPMAKVSYANTIIPILLTVWIMSYVYKFLNKHITPTLRTILVAPLTVGIMVPLSLCVLGPLGSWIGDAFCGAIVKFGNYGGIAAVLTSVIIGALWEFLVLTGMHLAMMPALLMIFAQVGYENVITVGSLCATFAVSGVAIGAALKASHDKEDRSLFWGFFVSSFIGGVTEPSLYGLIIPHKKTFIGLMAGGAAGALYGALTHVARYIPVGPSNFLLVTSYVGGKNSMSLVNAIIAAAIAVIVSAIVTYIVGYKDNTVQVN